VVLHRSESGFVALDHFVSGCDGRGVLAWQRLHGQGCSGMSGVCEQQTSEVEGTLKQGREGRAKVEAGKYACIDELVLRHVQLPQDSCVIDPLIRSFLW